MKTNLLYTIIFFFSIFSLSTNAADVVVNGSGLSGTYTTISAGINAANPGDRILVSNQSFPYQEDTIFIDKDVTIIPYNDVSHINYEGHIKITLDSISNLTLIGFDSESSHIRAEFNDTSRNSLTTINIIDCHFAQVHLSFPKTSVYVSYSTLSELSLAHGDVIGNYIWRLFLGDFDENNNYYIQQTPFDEFRFFDSYSQNSIGANDWPNECELDNGIIPFGNVNPYSDTCNIIGNSFQYFISLTKDFALNFRNNNQFGQNYFTSKIFSFCPPSKGINNFINNDFLAPFYVELYKCSSNSYFNAQNISFNFLNNSTSNGYGFRVPNNYSYYNSSNISGMINNSVSAYNSNSSFNCYGPYGNLQTNFQDSIISNGPNNTSGNNPNPSSEFLNLDLSLNIVGSSGGSYAWTNINPTGTAGFGQFTGSKARITYLNLPTQIFDPSNIRIKAKAVHGN